MTAWLDGSIVGDGQLPKRTGVAPFETMGAEGGELPLWDLHVARLQATASRLGLSWPSPTRWRAAAGELLRGNGHADAVLRLVLVPSGAALHVVMTTRGRSPVQLVRLLPTVVERPAAAPPADVKAEPRAFYDAVRQQAQDGEADDGIVVGKDGAVLETATANLWLRLDGAWTTPALDGRVLPGIARGLLLRTAARGGVRLAERPCTLADLHRADALAVSNAVYGVRAAALVGEQGGVAFVDSELVPIWRAARTNVHAG
jgi:branched-subunit amino acid aminotransferase/4-amino-4-deoxychorismate lyase